MVEYFCSKSNLSRIAFGFLFHRAAPCLSLLLNFIDEGVISNEVYCAIANAEII